MDLTPSFTWTQGQQENSLEGQVFQWGLFQGFKVSLCQLVQYQGKIPGGDTPPTLGSVSVEAIQETGEILIFADINGEVSQLVSNGWSVAINGARLQLPVLEQVQKEVSYGFQRWCPEVHLITQALLCKNGPLCLIDGSGWSTLRSLNLCCHCLREALFLDCCGSRSQACRFRFDRFLCRVWLIGWVTRLGRLGTQWDLTGHGHYRSQNQGMLGHAGQSVWACCMGNPATSPTLCPIWLLVGRHMGPDLRRTARVSTSTVQAWGSGTGDTNSGSWTWWQTGPTGAGATGSILLGRPLDGGTILFEWSGLVWIVCYHVQPAWDVSSFEGYPSPSTPGQDSPQKGIQRVRLHPPSLFIYVTSVVLFVATRTKSFKHRSWNSLRARKTAFSFRWFMCSLLSGRDQVPLAVCSFKWAPHPSFDA